MRSTETDRPVGAVSERALTLKLLFAAGSTSQGLAPRTYCLPNGQSRIGRDVPESEGIALPGDEKVSRQHARIQVTRVGDMYRVEVQDEGSKNGSYLNGVRVSAGVLGDGEVLRVGNSLFLLRTESVLDQDSDVPQLMGSAPVIRKLRRELAATTHSRGPVLLLGEPGVGKEVAAQAVHGLSGRAGSYVAYNCAGLTESLADSQLFGHERGAFTGANGAAEGLFRTAEGGTLFLDEVAELPLSVQAKLLRALQESEITPLGRQRPLRIDVRVVAATNRNLEQAIRAGAFRDDLFSRLRGSVINLPPLRQRREDILVLLQHFLGCPPRLSARLAEALLLYHWPHNVRELCLLADSIRVAVKQEDEIDLPCVAGRFLVLPEEPTVHKLPVKAGSHLSRETLERLLREHGHNITHLSAALGLSRRQVRRWLEKYGLLHPE